MAIFIDISIYLCNQRMTDIDKLIDGIVKSGYNMWLARSFVIISSSIFITNMKNFFQSQRIFKNNIFTKNNIFIFLSTTRFILFIYGGLFINKIRKLLQILLSESFQSYTAGKMCLVYQLLHTQFELYIPPEIKIYVLYRKNRKIAL